MMGFVPPSTPRVVLTHPNHLTYSQIRTLRDAYGRYLTDDPVDPTVPEGIGLPSLSGVGMTLLNNALLALLVVLFFVVWWAAS